LELSEFPTGVANPEELTLQALADILGIDKSLFVISEDARRAAVVRFQIYSSPEQIDRVMLKCGACATSYHELCTISDVNLSNKGYQDGCPSCFAKTKV
jgi:hypothetical protein